MMDCIRDFEKLQCSSSFVSCFCWFLGSSFWYWSHYWSLFLKGFEQSFWYFICSVSSFSRGQVSFFDSFNLIFIFLWFSYIYVYIYVVIVVFSLLHLQSIWCMVWLYQAIWILRIWEVVYAVSLYSYGKLKHTDGIDSEDERLGRLQLGEKGKKIVG